MRTLDWLREEGDAGYEATVLWAGTFLNEKEFIVEVPVLPKQYSIRTEEGMGVLILEDDIFEVNKWLYENKRELIAQLHTHPDAAFHSDTDAASSLVTAVGQFSIVIPYFAKQSFCDLSNCAVFRLRSSGQWTLLSGLDVSNVFEVLELGSG